MIELTKRQKAAAHHYTNPAIVIAGPGSGKTRVLIERIRFLIEEKGILPGNILAVTFTQKAAEQMSTRLYETIGEKAQSVHVSTIHSFCRTIMEDYFNYHDFGTAFNILDGEDQKLFILANKYRLGLAGRQGWLKLIRKAAGYISNPEEQVCLFYNTITENSIDIEALTGLLDMPDIYAGDIQALVSSYGKYTGLLQEEKLVDFAHLQAIVLKMLKQNAGLREDVQRHYTFILVDEYQDTSPVQDELISLVTAKHKNIFVVGDENQSIYGFRGAVAENFSRFPEHYPGVKTYFLNKNFRSAKNIVETANKLLESKLKEKLLAHRQKGNEIILITGENRRTTAQKTVAFLKKRIKEGRLSIGDTAFLYRKKSLAAEITAALSKYGFAFVTDNDGRFLERKEIRDIINLFGYLHQSQITGSEFRNWGEWWRPDLFDNEIITFSKKTLAVLHKLPRNTGLGHITAADKAAALGIKNRHDCFILTELNRIRSEIETGKTGLLDTIYQIFKITGYLSFLFNHQTEENREKLFNLARLTRLIAGYERQFSRPSAKNLLWLLYNKSMDKSIDQVIIGNKNAAKCMTVHKAKGLEFPAVVVCSLIEGDFPLRYRHGKTVCGISIPAALLKTRETDEKSHFAEELRLFYVAITRAQDLLIITVPEKINVKKARRSRFLDIINEYLTEEIGADIKMETTYEQPRSVASMSYSAAYTYYDCPFRYKINYLYEFTSPTEPMQRQGIIIHNVLQKVNWALKNSITVTPSAIRDFIEKSWIPISGKKSDEKLKQNYHDKTGKYLVFAQKELSEIDFFEKPFTFINEIMIVRGKADLIARDKSGKRVLIDFKARTAEGIEKTGVREQLNIYRYCLEDTGIQRMATYTFFDNRYIEFTYDHRAAEQFLKLVSDGLKAELFPLNKKSFQCPACYYQFICKGLKNG